MSDAERIRRLEEALGAILAEPFVEKILVLQNTRLWGDVIELLSEADEPTRRAAGRQNRAAGGG